MSDIVIEANRLGKMYHLFTKPSDKIWEALGLARYMPWKKNTYKEFWALRDFSLTLRKGERVGLIGRNGSGKSTLLKMIAGTVAASEGSLRVVGNVQALMELGTGFHPEFTGRENIVSSLGHYGLSTREINDSINEIIDFSELEDFIDQPVKGYSAGMYARLAFATATSIRPDILIIDEILGAGDAYFAGKCLERMRSLTANQGTTVLFVSHSIEAVQQLCTRAVWIERGRIKQDGLTVDVAKAYYRSIQREEMLFRKAREQGIRKARGLPSWEADGQQVLFRFVTTSPHPKKRHKIRSLALFRGAEKIQELHVGGAMDNQPESATKILDAPGYMDWSKPQKDEQGYFRFYQDCKGIYNHAPWEFGLTEAAFPSPEYSLRIEANVEIDEDVIVQLYWNDTYHTLAKLKSGTCDHVCSIPSFDEAIEKKSILVTDIVSANSIVSWEKPDPCIVNVYFLNADGDEVTGVEELEDLIIAIAYQSSKRVESPVFSMSIFKATGEVLCHANMSLARFEIDAIEGAGEVRFTFPKFAGTAGDYMMGCSIFHYLDAKNYHGQPPYYDQHDRAYKFKIWKKPDTNMMLGFARLPFVVSHHPAR
jgi:lipopolysaccharide transport system ATP-binding protein